jgi:hypothetical protein
MKQNDAVFQAVKEVLGQDSFSSAVMLTKDQRATVIDVVTAAIMNGSVDFSAEAKLKHDTPAKVKTYTTGMVSNHLRKDKRLNGGTKYEIKKPGSRAGSGDAALKAMKTLRDTLTDEAQIAAVDEAIEKRTAELATAKKKVEIDVELLPESLRHLVPTETSDEE